MKMTDDREPQALMQADGYLVVGIDAGDHDMLGAGGRARQEFNHELPADSPTTAVRAHVNAMLDAMPIAGPCAKLAEGGEPNDA